MLELLIEAPDGAEEVVEIAAPAVVIAGFTGRDPAAVQDHIRELGTLGVAAPATVPAFYTVPDWTLTQPRTGIQVPTDRGSGEAEPVLVSMPDGATYLTVGSDHTDRELEAHSIELAKRIHPKVIGKRAWAFADVERTWDELRLRSWAGASRRPYQDGRLGELLPPLEILERVRAEVDPPTDRPLIAFLGTVPLVDGFSFDRSFRTAIDDPHVERRLSCDYEVDPIANGRGGEAR